MYLLFLHVVWLAGDYLSAWKLLPRKVNAAHTRLALKLDLLND